METSIINNRDKLIQKAVKMLKNIQTVDDLKASKEELMDLIENIMKGAVEALRDFLENIFQYSADERRDRSKEFQNEDYLLSPEIMQELQRLDTIPGSGEIGEAFGKEMETRMGPYLEEFTQKMGKLMDNFMGDLVEGIDVMDSGTGEEVEEPEDRYEFDYDNPDTPAMLYYLYDARTLEALRENKNYLLESLDEQLQSDIWDMQVLVDLEPELLDDRDKTKISDIRKRMERLIPEMEKEFDRIAALPGAENHVREIRIEIQEGINDKVAELKGYLNLMK